MDDQSVAKILEEIQKSKNELVKTIEASEIRLRFEIEGQNNKIKQIIKENNQLKEELEKLETANRKNNIILFGLNKKPQDISAAVFCQEIQQLVDVNVTEQEINNIYCLGKGPNPPIKVELTTYLQKNTILKNCYKLKGINITITHDLTVNQREDQKILRFYLRKEKESSSKRKCFIKGNKLVIDNKEYSVEELNNSEDLESERKPASAPDTPNRLYMPAEGEEDQPKIAEVKGKKVAANKNSTKPSRLLRSVISSSQS